MDTLNEKQTEFVECDGNILLLASAGTGKTRCIASKISRLINEKKLEPSRVLCLTFTNKACEETKERLLSAVGGAALSATVRTFHSFCFQIIDFEKRRTSGFFPENVIYDEEDCKELISSIVDGVEGDIQKYVDAVKEYRNEKNIFTDDSDVDIIKAFQIIKNTDVGYLTKRITGKSSNLIQTFLDKGEDIIREYQKALADNNAFDFNDLVSGVYLLFMNQEVVARWRDKFSFICIDEAQDTSISEYRLISRLFGNSQIVLCGDFFQTIYKWRGSDPDYLISSFSEKYNPQKMSFDINYRSTKTLVNSCFHVLEGMFGMDVRVFYPNGVVPFSDETGDPIHLLACDNEEAECSCVYQKIENLAQTTELSKMCILTRSNKYGLRMAAYIRSRSSDLNCFLIGDLKFYRRPEIKDVFSFLRLIINRHDSLSASRIAQNYISGVGEATLKELSQVLKEEISLSLSDFIDLDTIKCGDPYYRLLDGLNNYRVVVFDTETTGLDVTKDEIVQISGEKIGIDGAVVSTFNAFIKPTKSVGVSFNVHGISDEFLQNNGEDPVDVLTRFQSFIDGCILVGHNVSFDIGILTSELKRHGLVLDKQPIFYDTCLIAKRVYPKGPKNYKLSYLSQEYFNFSHQSSHKSDDDVGATVELLMKMVNDDILPGAVQRQEIMTKYGYKFLKFATFLSELRREANDQTIDSLVSAIIEKAKIRDHYSKSQERMQALDNLIDISKVMKDQNKNTFDSIQELLNISSLTNTEIDVLCKNKNLLPIITVHQAKGAEFEDVFLVGFNDGNIPNYYGNIEEEKHIFYVAITRAMKRLFITYTQTNQRGYQTEISRFAQFLPSDVVDF
jgi:DNA helicase-2/ATP-dependent DNA helicase PcrA